MSPEEESSTLAGPKLDDGYWAALFEQEKTDAAEQAADRQVDQPVHGEGEDFDWPGNGVAPSHDPWQLAQEFMQTDRVLQLRVSGSNKGGLLVHWKGIQGFVPASQLIDFPQFHVLRERTQALAGWRDRVLDLKIIEVNRASNRLILSERAVLSAATQRERLLHSVKKGDRLTGKVTNLTDFGVFVDLGGVEGLIHISELSWSRVTHPSSILRPGQEVNVVVLNVDQDAERVALSVKRLRTDPWENVEQRYQPNQIVHGVIGNVVTYGAFVILEEELEGLVHISELAEGTFLHPRDVVRTGDAVVARVLHVDGRAKRLALSMRGVNTPAKPG